MIQPDYQASYELEIETSFGNVYWNSLHRIVKTEAGATLSFSEINYLFQRVFMVVQIRQAICLLLDFSKTKSVPETTVILQKNSVGLSLQYIAYVCPPNAPFRREVEQMAYQSLKEYKVAVLKSLSEAEEWLLSQEQQS